MFQFRRMIGPNQSRSRPQYQLCGGLDFYLGRSAELLEPAGFEPPTYLLREADEIFISRERSREAWASAERIFSSRIVSSAASVSTASFLDPME